MFDVQDRSPSGRSRAIADALAQISDAVRTLDAALSDATAADRVAVLRDALLSSDRLVSTATRALGNGNAVAAVTGMPTEMLLMLEARRTPWDARTFTYASAQLATMPQLAEAFAAGFVSWGQVRAITAELRRTTKRVAQEVDTLVGEHAVPLALTDTDRLVELVQAHVQKRRSQLVTRMEERAARGSYFALQPDFLGGAQIHGYADAERAATIAEALDAAADRPQRAETAEVSRGAQRLDALVRICEQSLAGGAGTRARPRPRLYAFMDFDAYARGEKSANLLWRLRGRLPKFSAVTTETLVCDSTLVPILTRNGMPVAVGQATHVFSDTVREAILARDGGCRTPGCDVPMAWCDAHHIVPGHGNGVRDGVGKCRHCHVLAHKQKWKIMLHADGTATYVIRGRTYTSYPRAGPHAL